MEQTPEELVNRIGQAEWPKALPQRHNLGLKLSVRNSFHAKNNN